MTKLKVWLLIIVVFLAGFAVGVVTVRAGVRRFVSSAMQNPDRVRELIERRLDTRLGLNPDQRRQAHAILIRRQAELRDLRHEFAPRFGAILAGTEEDISAILTPDQQVRFEDFKRENRRFLQPR